MAAENFDAIAMGLTHDDLSREGKAFFPGNSRDPNPTQDGITQRVYDAYLRRNNLPQTSVQNLTPAQHSAITREDFWNRIQGDQLPSGLDYQALDTAFNAGIPRAAYLMKQALGLPLLGTSSVNEPWTEDIIPAARAAADEGTLPDAIGSFTQARHELYRQFRNADHFHGWFTRFDRVGDAAQRLAAQGPLAILRNVPEPPTRPNEGQDGTEARPPEAVEAFNRASDAVTEGLEAGARAFRDVAGNIIREVGGFFNPAAPVQTVDVNAPFSSLNTSGGVGRGSFGSDITPTDPRQSIDPSAPFSGTNVSSGVGNGSLSTGINSVPGVTSASFAGSFDPSAYLAANPDVAASEQFRSRPFDHYLRFGEAEGRDLSPEAGIQRAPIGAFDFSGRQVSTGVGNGTLRTGLSLPSLQEAARVNPVETLYQTFLGRSAATDPGAQQLAAAIQAGQVNLVQAEEALRRSPEAQAYLQGNPTLAPTLQSTSVASLIGPPPGQPVQNLGMAPTVSAPSAQAALPPNFDEIGYLLANLDVRAAGIDAEQHYRDFGAAEGRTIAPEGYAPLVGPQFDEQAYYLQNPDVLAARVPAVEHFLNFGRQEGRALAPEGYVQSQGTGPAVGGLPPGYTFNAADYLAANPDVAVSSEFSANPLSHFQRFGFDEGRSLNTQGLRLTDDFDGGAYLTQNRDVATAGLDPLAHFLKHGASEGRGATIGINPYEFSTFNPSSGAPNASFGTGIQSPPGLTAAGSAGGGVGVSAAGGGGMAPSPVNAYAGGKAGFGASGAGGGGINLISPTGFSGRNVSQGVAPGAFNSPGAISSAVNLGFGGQAPGTISPYGFGSDVSGFDPNAGGGAPAPTPLAISRPGFGGFASDVAAQNSARSQQNFIANEAHQRAQFQGQADAAALQRANIGPGAPVVTFQTQGFNPEALGGSSPGAVQFMPTAAPAPVQQFNNNLVSNNIQQGANAASNFFARMASRR